MAISVKSLLDLKHTLFAKNKLLKIEAAKVDTNDSRRREIQVEINCNEKQIEAIDHDVEILSKMGED